MENNICNIPRGKGLGGTTLINSLRYVRGNRKDFDHWSERGNPGWSYDYVLPYFKKYENTSVENVDFGYHGYEGPIHSENVQPYTRLAKAIVKANYEMGYKSIDYNGENQLGISRSQQNTFRGVRSDVGKGYIDPIINRKSVMIYQNSFVIKIAIDKNKTATGVVFTNKQGTFKINARKEVIISAGVICSPQILMLSGIGPGDHLRDIGIKVIQDLAVGQNLVEHPAFNGIFINTNVKGYKKSIKDNLKDYFRGLGQLTVALGTQVLGFYHSVINNLAFDSPDIEVYFKPPSYQVDKLPKSVTGLKQEIFDATYKNVNPNSTLEVNVLAIKTKSRGVIKLVSKDPFQYPLIDYKFFSDPENHDINVIYAGIQQILEMLNTPSFQKLNATLEKVILPPCKKFAYLSKDYWFCRIKYLTSLGHHPMGTCRMGPDPFSGDVVDHNLKVHGINRLRVVDASVFDLISGHTSAAASMIAEKISDMIKLEYGIKIEDLDQEMLTWQLLNYYSKM